MLGIGTLVPDYMLLEDDMSQYLHIGIVLITIPNLIIIGLMVIVFIVAVALTLPQQSE